MRPVSTIGKPLTHFSLFFLVLFILFRQYHPTAYHPMQSGETALYQQYKVPLAVHIVDQGGRAVKSTWQEWHSADAYRQSLAKDMQFEE